jgi:hypothetical protein
MLNGLTAVFGNTPLKQVDMKMCDTHRLLHSTCIKAKDSNGGSGWTRIISEPLIQQFLFGHARHFKSY